MEESISIKDKKFLDDYWSRYQKLFFESRNDESILNFRNSIRKTFESEGRLVFVGNGASASLASHAATDFSKQAKIKAIALNDHNLITALSNDYGYELWIEKILDYHSSQKDIVMFLSVSGESKNLLKGAEFARMRGLKVISFTGMRQSNSLSKLSDYNFWVNSSAYNIVENIHMIWATTLIDMIIGSDVYAVS